MVSETGGDDSGNATLDCGRALCFPLGECSGDGNKPHDAGRVTSASHHATRGAAEAAGVGAMGSGTRAGLPNGKSGYQRVIQEDPTARACEKATGPIPRFTGPVPNIQCSIIVCPYCEGRLTGPSGNPCTLCNHGLCIVGRFTDPRVGGALRALIDSALIASRPGSLRE